MYPNASPTDVRQEYEARVAQAVRQEALARAVTAQARLLHPQEENVPLDFTDYNKQRLATISAARRQPVAQAPPRTLWGILRRWTVGGWLWMGQPRRG